MAVGCVIELVFKVATGELKVSALGALGARESMSGQVGSGGLCSPWCCLSVERVKSRRAGRDGQSRGGVP